MLSFQEALSCLFVSVFGIETNDPEEWNRVAKPHDGRDGTHVLLETHVLERAGEKSDHAIEIRFRDNDGYVVERHGKRCSWDVTRVIVSRLTEDSTYNFRGNTFRNVQLEKGHLKVKMSCLFMYVSQEIGFVSC